MAKKAIVPPLRHKRAAHHREEDAPEPEEREEGDGAEEPDDEEDASEHEEADAKPEPEPVYSKTATNKQTGRKIGLGKDNKWHDIATREVIE